MGPGPEAQIITMKTFLTSWLVLKNNCTERDTANALKNSNVRLSGYLALTLNAPYKLLPA